MKTSKLFVGLLLLCTSLAFIRCTPDQDFSQTTKDIISQGTWTVDYFYEGQDRTAQFTSYEFNFTGNGSVTGKTSSTEFSGTWSLMKDVNRNDVIQIFIQNDPQLSQMNEIWSITDRSNEVIAMNGPSAQLRIRKM